MMCKRCNKLLFFRTYCDKCTKRRNKIDKELFEANTRARVSAEQFEREVMIDQPYKDKTKFTKESFMKDNPCYTWCYHCKAPRCSLVCPMCGEFLFPNFH